jgi:hypothetical protein
MVDTGLARALMAHLARLACERVWRPLPCRRGLLRHLILRGIGMWGLQQRGYYFGERSSSHLMDAVSSAHARTIGRSVSSFRQGLDRFL